MTQLVIPQTVLVTTEVNGIEMGVLSDGTPYLTLRGLARACGIAASTINEPFAAWAKGQRTGKLARALTAAGFVGDRLSIEMPGYHAVPDAICILVLEHYALDQDNKIALANYRVLARRGLRAFIYDATGYDPSRNLPRGWRDFHDRLMLSKLPTGFFGGVREMSEFLLRLIQAGLVLDENTVVDISVGQLWSKHWVDNDLAVQFGERAKYDHNYPDYYPQSASNPQETWCYPLKALGAFREWLEQHYIPVKVPKYIASKVRASAIDATTAAQLISAAAGDALAART